MPKKSVQQRLSFELHRQCPVRYMGTEAERCLNPVIRTRVFYELYWIAAVH